MIDHCDVTIVGGGIVGSTLALILANAGLHTLVVESITTEKLNKQALSKRTLVLAYSSRLIFETLGLWQEFEPYACPIHNIHVSDRGKFGTSQIRAVEEKVPALGYVLPAGKINAILHNAVLQHSHITVQQPATYLAHHQEGTNITVQIQKEGLTTSVDCELLVAADGQESAVRKFLNIKLKRKEYDQTAIFCDVALKRAHQNIAYERFTDQGPLAILPLLDKQGAVIWTLPTLEAQKFQKLNDREFLQALQGKFGYRLGKFLSCGERKSVPLTLTTVSQQVKAGIVLVGNAAHTLHPVAGQGLNLGLRDIASLGQEVVQAKRNGKCLGDLLVLNEYLAKRQSDQNKIINLTHSLVSVFSTTLLPVMLARMSGLVVLDRLAVLKNNLARTTLGFSGRVPRLACGMSLE